MTLIEFMAETRKEFPDFKIQSKAESAFMLLIAKLLLVVTFGTQKTFMTSYITTIDTTVYVPEGWDAWNEQRRLSILRHERVHMRQAKRLTFPVFALLYLLAPLPLGFAWCRARFEWEAYTESMRAVAEMHGIKILDDDKYKKSITDQFTTGAYGWMWPFPAQLNAWYEASKEQIRTESRRWMKS